MFPEKLLNVVKVFNRDVRILDTLGKISQFIKTTELSSPELEHN